MNVQEFLRNYPWPQEWVEKGQPLNFLWQFDLPVTVEKIWPHLIDTSSFNRRLQLPEMNFSEKNGRLFGSSVNAGIKMEWEEVPWQWEYGRWLSSARIYSRGFATYVRARYILEPVESDAVRLLVYFGWIPRDWKGRLLLRMGMKQLQEKYKDALQQIAASIKMDKALAQMDPPVVFSESAREKLSQIRRQLLSDGIEEGLLDRLLQYIETAGESTLARIRVRALSTQWNVSLRDLLSLCLQATRKGLFLLTWDVVCPHCRGVRSELAHLGEVPKKDHCDACEIDIDATGLNSLEVTFHLHPSICRVTKRFFCSAEPAKKPHIRIQESLQSGESKEIQTLLDSGRYRLRTKGRTGNTLLTITSESSFQKADWVCGQTGEEIRVCPKPILTLMNHSSNPQTFVLEESAEDQFALRPVDLFDFQDFRDLFSAEALAVDVELDVGVQVVLFTDIVGSTKFYETEGDSGAFAAVRQHFVKAYDIVRRHQGAIVKTIGDAVMAAFVEAAPAMKAAVELQQYFNGKNPDTTLRLRVTLHAGSCLAVNLNSNIDYFGSTVNLAAKLQSIASAGQIAFTDAVYSESSVRDVLNAAAAQVETVEFPLSWSTGSIQVRRVQIS